MPVVLQHRWLQGGFTCKWAGGFRRTAQTFDHLGKPYPKEFRDDVVNVARGREPGQTIKQIAADFGIAESCLRNWMRHADVEGRAQARNHRSGQRRAA